MSQEEEVVNTDQVMSENIENQETLIVQFIQEMNLIYNDYFRRTNIEEWKRLFTSDSFRHISLDDDFYECVCKNLLTNNALPYKIWQFIDGKLSLCAWINDLENKNLKRKYSYITCMIQIGNELNYNVSNLDDYLMMK